MKRKNVFYVLVAIIMIALVFTVSSCAHKSDKEKTQTPEEIAASITDDDVIWVQACINKMQTIHYDDPDVFIQNIKQDRQNWKADSIINSIPEQTLKQMCNVVYHKYATINKELIIDEYKQSYTKVYKYLDTDEPISQLEKTDTMEVK